MDVLRRADLEALMGVREGPCVSIFMPTHRVTGVQQDPIRLKNVLKHAEERLESYGVRAPEARRILEPAHHLLPDDLYWLHQEDGLAAFLSPGLSRFYRLPLPFEERCVIGDRFHIKPVLPLLTGDGRFYILALSQNEVRLFRGTRYSVSPVSLPAAPRSLAEALKYDESERQLQLHQGTTTGTGAIYHGHGVGVDDAKSNIRRYLQQVDRGLRALLREERAPLLLAGVEYLQPIYKEVSTYPTLLPQGLTGNPEGLRPEELHREAWDIVRPYFEQDERKSIDLYYGLKGNGRASTDILQILPAAAQGRVDRVFVAVGVQRWGRFDPAGNRAVLHDPPQPGDDDLLDLAAAHTLRTGGVVYSVEAGRVPDNAPAAAIFRY